MRMIDEDHNHFGFALDDGRQGPEHDLRVIPIVNPPKVENRRFLAHPLQKTRITLAGGRSLPGGSKRQFSDQALQLRVVFKDEWIDPSEGAKPPEIEEALLG
jgi:hypothetical protein